MRGEGHYCQEVAVKGSEFTIAAREDVELKTYFCKEEKVGI